MSKKRRSTEFKNSSRVIDMGEARSKRQAKRESQMAIRKKRERAKKAEPETRGKRAIRRKRNRTRLWIASFALFIIVIVLIASFSVISLIGEKKRVEAEHQELLKEKSKLEKQLKEAKDKNNLEDLARQDLGLIKSGEVLYMFPSDFNKEKQEKNDEN